MTIFVSKDCFDTWVSGGIVVQDGSDDILAGIVIADAEFPVGKVLAEYAFNAGFQVFSAAVISRDDNTDCWRVRVES